MATFKVGQRVKLIVKRWGDCVWGDEGTVCGPDIHYQYTVQFDRVPGNRHFCNDYHLAPLTDPDEAAQRFLQSLKNLKPYEEPTCNPYRAPTTKELADMDRAAKRWLEEL
jgi:hypothetical protein